MKVSQLATRTVLSVDPDDSLDKGIALMDEHAIHHLPVVEDGRIVGMLSDRDLLTAVGWKLAPQRRLGRFDAFVGPSRIGQVMSSPVVSIEPSESVSRAARIMIRRRIGALPLVSHDRLVGMLTETDLVRALRDRTMYRSALPSLSDESVAEHMRTNVVTVGPRHPLFDVERIFREKELRHVPVIMPGPSGERVLIGIVSDRDVRRAHGLSSVREWSDPFERGLALREMTAMDVMSTNVHTVGSDTALDDAIDAMLMHRIHALPVLVDEALAGIITQTDIIRAIGAREPV